MFSSSVVSDFVPMNSTQASPSFTISQSLLKLMWIELVMPSNHLILCHPLLPSIFSRIGIFSNELALCIMWPKDRSFNFSISPSNEYSQLISFRIDWFDLFPLQGTLESSLALLFESNNSSASSLLYGPTLTSVHDYWKKNIASIMQTFVSLVMSLLFNTLSRIS